MHLYFLPKSEIYDKKNYDYEAVPTNGKQVRFSLKGSTFINRFHIAEPFI